MARFDELLKDWHEFGRQKFESALPGLDYDRVTAKTAKEKKKYVYLDEGSSGVFMVEKITGNIYRIKAYGVINRKKLVGNIANVTGEVLHNARGL